MAYQSAATQAWNPVYQGPVAAPAPVQQPQGLMTAPGQREWWNTFNLDKWVKKNPFEGSSISSNWRDMARRLPYEQGRQLMDMAREQQYQAAERESLAADQTDSMALASIATRQNMSPELLHRQKLEFMEGRRALLDAGIDPNTARYKDLEGLGRYQLYQRSPHLYHEGKGSFLEQVAGIGIPLFLGYMTGGAVSGMAGSGIVGGAIGGAATGAASDDSNLSKYVQSGAVGGAVGGATAGADPYGYGTSTAGKAATGATTGMLTSAGGQLATTGRIDPRQTLTAGAAGGASAGAGAATGNKIAAGVAGGAVGGALSGGRNGLYQGALGGMMTGAGQQFGGNLGQTAMKQLYAAYLAQQRRV